MKTVDYTPATPSVSVIMANYNGARYIESSISSALNQTVKDIEIIVVDDASTDGSLEIVKRMADKDQRITVIAKNAKGGPGSSRNRALEVARGKWIAVLDSDDMFHLDRLRLLISAAETNDAQACVDDLLIFDGVGEPYNFFNELTDDGRWITLAEYAAQNDIFGSRPALGILKPVFRSDFLRKNELRYNEELQIGEDYDILFKLMSLGGKVWASPIIGYFYRKHSVSISFRISREHVTNLIDLNSVAMSEHSAASSTLQQALRSRQKKLILALAFTDLINYIKRKSFSQSLSLIFQHPRLLLMLRMPVLSRLNRLYLKFSTKRQTGQANEKWAVIISKQRIVGPINGSSTYLLSLCACLKREGFKLALIQPSPVIFGRWPYLPLGESLNVFDQISIRGGFFLKKSLVVTTDFKVYFRVMLWLIEKLAVRLSLAKKGRISKPAQYAVGLPWSRADCMFVAKVAPKSPTVVLADYVFQSYGIPYTFGDFQKSAVIMHDLFSSRAAQFNDIGTKDSVLNLHIDDEMRMLGMAAAVIAIQPAEGLIVRKYLADSRIIVAPLAAVPVTVPQKGGTDYILFVGSNTAPNVDGLAWFVDRVWPLVLSKKSDIKLVVVGSVGNADLPRSANIEYKGVVESLEDFYAHAGVVISPLRAGSGLKIKLVEALARGKAIVATSTTLQGFDDLIADAVVVSDEPETFADALIDLLYDSDKREIMGAKALEAAGKYFGMETSYADFIDFCSMKVENGSYMKSSTAEFE